MEKRDRLIGDLKERVSFLEAEVSVGVTSKKRFSAFQCVTVTYQMCPAE